MFCTKRFVLGFVLLFFVACAPTVSELEPAVVGSNPAGQLSLADTQPTETATILPTTTLPSSTLRPPTLTTAQATATTPTLLVATPTETVIMATPMATATLYPTAEIIPTFTPTVLISCTAVTEIPQTECEALEDFYYQLNVGGSRSHTIRWLSTTSPCQWDAITCEDGHVIRITFMYQFLKGTIPASIGNLTYLKTLSLRDEPSISGVIPAEIGQLTHLETLDLVATSLTGSIPAELGQLTQLKWLDLSLNKLTGSIPAELGQLTKLEHLGLGTNQLTGSIPPELGQLTQLKVLYLGDLTGLAGVPINQLTGPIPAELGQLTQLQSLVLNNNQLTGPIPMELGLLNQLTNLNLAQNPGLNQALPTNFTQLTLTTFSYDQTGVCAPNTPEFQNWLASIPTLSSNGQTCTP